ncbi:MAG: hypothetical protein IJZ87_01790 [Bacteroidales bacterium]|nr:hypothetical protein [Bacteroidales bacterium]
MILYTILLIVVFLVFVAFVREKVYVYSDGIKIKDVMYPLWIPNDTIVSVSMIDKMPKLIYRTNGTGLGRIQKGYFTIKKSDDQHSENATLYTRNSNIPAIEIRTTTGLVYINLKNEDLTKELFDDIKNNVKILKENDLNFNAKRPRTYRSVVIIFLFLFILLFPVLFVNYSNEIIVNNDMVKIEGEYEMEVPLSDVDTILLIEKLPAIKLRTNGISTRKVNIGHFKTSDGRRCRLYVNNDVPLYIEIRRDVTPVASENQSNLIFINRKTVEETRMLYEEIFNSMYN